MLAKLYNLGTILMIAGFIALIGFAIYDYNEYNDKINHDIRPNSDRYMQQIHDLEQESDSALQIGGDAGVAVALHILSIEAAISDIDDE